MQRFKRIYTIIWYVLIAVLAVSTFCNPAIYSRRWFMALWVLVGAGLALMLPSLRRHPGLFVLHLSFQVILIGGLFTSLTAREGTIVLTEGQTDSCYVSNGEPHRLGATLQLRRFEIIHYPGGEVARDYVSHLLVDGTPRELSVNKPLSLGDFRLYQTSYLDEKTTVIGVRADSLGRNVSFVGYALFLLGGLLTMFWRRRKALLACVLLVVAGSAHAAVPVINPEATDSLARLQVRYQGRTVTLSTVCHDVLLKVYGRRSYKGLSAERTVLSMQAFPREWADQPIIKRGQSHVSFRRCFDAEGRYVMTADVAADERVGVLLLLTRGELFAPAESTLSAAQVEAEIIYNRVPFTMIIFIGLFFCAALSFFRRRWARWGSWPIMLLQLAVIGIECWLTGHGPFASMFETLQLLVVVTLLIALLARGALSIGLLAAGCLALVAHLNASNPMVTPLMPVLHSPWLSMHVSLVMTAYALLVVGSLMAAVGLLNPRRDEELRSRSLGLIRPGVFLLGLGIFSGAVWADVSWGRYWGWDPKETWALVTFMLYAVPLHRKRPSFLWLLLPVLSIAMTYFGVNYLSSLHAYQ